MRTNLKNYGGAMLLVAVAVVAWAASPCAVVIEPPRISNLDSTSFWAHCTPPADFDSTTHYQLNINGALYGGSSLWPDIFVKVLEPGHVGHVRVVVYQKGKILGVSTATVVLLCPDAPANVAVFDLGTATFRLRWDAVETAIGYKIFRDLDFLQAEVPASPTWTIVTGLTAGQTYSFSVKAVNPSGDGLRSKSVDVTMRPNPVINLRADKIGSTSFTLAWDPVFGAASYSVEVQGQVVATVAARVNSFRVTGCTAGATTTVRLFAINAGGTSSPSAPLSVLLTPPTPLQPWVTNVASFSFVLNWTPIPNINGYRVYRDAAWCVGNLPASQTSMRCDTWVNPGELASMTVLAFNSSGDSDQSPLLLVLPTTASRAAMVVAARYSLLENSPTRTAGGVGQSGNAAMIARLVGGRVGDRVGDLVTTGAGGVRSTLGAVGRGGPVVVALVGCPAERVFAQRLADDAELVGVTFAIVDSVGPTGAWILDSAGRIRGREPLVQPSLTPGRILQLLGPSAPARGPLGRALESERRRFEELHDH